MAENRAYESLDITIGSDKNQIEDGALQLLKKLRPNWNADNIKIKHFTEGISNKLVGCYEKDKDLYSADVILIRVYGEKTELFVDRNAEKRTFCKLSEIGCSPPLYAEFNNGICYGFFPGVTLDDKTVRIEKIRRLIAKEMVRLHTVPLPENERQSELFPRIRKFFNFIPDELENPDLRERYKKLIGKTKSELQFEADQLEDHVSNLDSPVVLCHNDLLLANIIYNEKTETTSFIDYEYSFSNYLAYDIGDHFTEYAGIDNIDYTKYPDKDYQLEWLECYLKYWNEVQGKEDDPVTQNDVETLYVQVNKFALASHFFWGLWGIVQAQNSKIDFDFLQFAATRLNEYFTKKDDFFALKLPQ